MDVIDASYCRNIQKISENKSTQKKYLKNNNNKIIHIICTTGACPQGWKRWGNLCLKM
jgi:hypothetical protein